MIELRPYQQEAVDAVYDFLRAKDTNPCVVAPTASGKSLMMAQIVTDAVTRWNGRVLLLAHVKELLEQNADKIKKLCPGIDVGIHSAGLGEAALSNQVIVAGIQSVYRKAEALGHFDIILIDECHLIPNSGDGMYRTFLAATKKVNPIVRVIGFTATPFRLNGGLICKPENMLNEVCYNIEIPYLIDHGYISKLISYEGEAEADLEHLHLRGGEFISEEVAAAMDSPDLVERACAEIITKTANRRSVIIFGASILHCQHISEIITRLSGLECPIVSGSTTAEDRALLLARFKGESFDDLFGNQRTKRLKYLVNVNVLTTGFDAPEIDCVVLLRPTASAALYIQMVGRGFRLAPGKENCLILDFGGNVLRHGPVNDIQVTDNGPASTTKKKPKFCPKCRAHLSSGTRVCPHCGYAFISEPREIKINGSASSLSVVGKRERAATREETFQVLDMRLYVHTKKDAAPDTPKSLRVEFTIEGPPHKVCIWKSPQSSSIWAKNRFRSWWRTLSTNPGDHVPRTAEEAVCRAEVSGELKQVETLTMQYKEGSNFGDDIGYEFAPPPQLFAIPEEWDDDLPF